jgi:hypothetical protein
MVGIGVLFLLQIFGGISATLFWPLVLGALGLAVLWRQADEAQRARWTHSSPGLPVIGPLLGAGGWPTLLRSGLGLALVVVAGTIILASSGQVGALAQAAAAVLVGLLGLGLIAAAVTVGVWHWRRVPVEAGRFRWLHVTVFVLSVLFSLSLGSLMAWGLAVAWS